MQTRQRNLVALAIDGIPAGLARGHWTTARIKTLASEFPTTSATSWLSSMSGLAPVDHGALGYWQRFDARQAAICVFEGGSGAFRDMETVFGDARRVGYEPVCLDGDLAHLPGAWRDSLLGGAQVQDIGRFYSGEDPSPDVGEVLTRLLSAINLGLKRRGPVFLWCYLDVDLYIHKHGYDRQVLRLLDGIEGLARTVSSVADVVAYSDHGLVPTLHDPDLAARLKALCQHFPAEMAGAGRTRWFYCEISARDELRAALAGEFGPAATIFGAADLFDAGHYRDRVGDLVALAAGLSFLSEPGYLFDHGSWQPDEVYVPFAFWSHTAG
ncbi:alkaline phosphatase family protein [Rhizobium johnstonii]|uniref:alkaline phosphatase family protein n=1 Tax=Rhizobium johnstonii TaxID=3019933 RepID=UPI003F9BEB54